jgi:hypothetical protein
MAAPLSSCCVEQQYVIHVLWSEGLKTSEIYRGILAQYGEHCIAQKNGLLLHENARCILRQLPWKQSGSWNFNFSHTPIPRWTGPSSSGHQMFKKPCMDKDLLVMIKLRMWCIRGFDHKQKLSFQMGWEGLNSYTICSERNGWLCSGMTYFAYVTDCAWINKFTLLFHSACYKITPLSFQWVYLDTLTCYWPGFMGVHISALSVHCLSCL